MSEQHEESEMRNFIQKVAHAVCQPDIEAGTRLANSLVKIAVDNPDANITPLTVAQQIGRVMVSDGHADLACSPNGFRLLVCIGTLVCQVRDLTPAKNPTLSHAE